MIAPQSPGLLKLLRELPTLQLPPRGELSTEAWLAACHKILPRETWVRVAVAVLSP
jgi:hypothetical protein